MQKGYPFFRRNVEKNRELLDHFRGWAAFLGLKLAQGTG
jgi:hypothetical protein